MANELQNFNGNNLPAAFAGGPIAGMGDMTEGVSAGFPVVSFKGKVWKIKAKGEETLWLDDRGQPAGYVEVVIVNASSAISKIWYEKQFREGEEMGPPDCWSTNGVVPDAAAPHKPSPTCAGCPKNVFGTSNTGKGKACGDVRRLAVVPADNIMDRNARFGGPMLLRVPPTSLTELASFQRKVASHGYPYYAVRTRISFDPMSAFQKLQFTAVRPLTDAEAPHVIAMGTDDLTQRMLNETVVSVRTNDDTQTVDQVFEQGTAGGIAPQQVATPFAQPTASAPASQATAATSAPALSSTPAALPAQAGAPDPFAAMRGLVNQGLMTKEQFKAATNTDFDPPAPAAAPWSAKPEHEAMAGLVKQGLMTPEQFAAAAGYAYGGASSGVAAGPQPTAPTPVQVLADAPAEPAKRKRRTKAEIDAEAAKGQQAAPAAQEEQVDDAEYTESPAATSLDAALDGLFS